MTAAGPERPADPCDPAGNGRPSHPRSRRLVSAAIVVVALAHFFAAFFPSVSNWGIHHLAFGPPFMKWLIPAAMLLLAVPRVQSIGAGAVRCCVAGWLRCPGGVRLALGTTGCAAAAGAFYAFRSAGILGDGLYLVNQMSLIRKPDDTVHVFVYEPLTGLVHWLVARGFFGDTGTAGAELSYRAVSIACGALFIPLLSAVLRRLVPRRSDRVFSFLFVIVSGSSVLFFGYIEHYTVAFLALLLFIHLSLKHSGGGGPLVLPSAALGLLIPLYFGMLVFLPVLACLFAIEYRAGRRAGTLLVSTAVFLAVCFGLLALTGYTPAAFVGMITGTGRHSVGVLGESPGMRGYTMFSWRHIADLANFVLLVSPGLALVFPLFAGARSGERGPGTRLLLILFAVCGVLLVLFFLCELGMPRDWDLLAPFMLGTILLAAYLAFGGGTRRPLPHAPAFAVAAVTALHTIPWVALNNSPEIGVAQFRMILDQTTWIDNIHIGYEGLVMAAKRRGDFRTAADVYGEYLRRDPGHARILGNLADVYRVLGVGDSEMVYDERAVRSGSVVPAVYFNLGIIYAKGERYADAIRVMREGLRLDPRRPDVLNSIGSLILRDSGECSAAMQYFLDAIAADPSYAHAYLNAGGCSAALGDTAAMRRYLLTYARLDPAGARRLHIDRRLGLSPGG